MARILITALYHFTPLPDYRELREPYRKKCRELGIKGSILLAEEGINGTLAGEEKGLRTFLSYLQEDDRFSNILVKESWTEEIPFVRLKVRLKNEIVTIGIPQVDPTKKVGTYVPPSEWNRLIQQDDVILIDTRNDYEIELGSFPGTINPKTDSFRDFPQWLKKQKELKPDARVAMYCTGGIRCEKASSYLLQEGFEEVYHLKGGVLKYLEEVPQEESLWDGECYVFDHRVSLDHNLESGRYDACMACGSPVDEKGKESDQYLYGVACPKCFEKTSDQDKKRFAQRQRQIELCEARNESHFDTQRKHKKKNENASPL